MRNKFEHLTEQVKVIIETKLDYTFPTSQFAIEGCSSPFRLDGNDHGGGIMLYIRKDIPSKLRRSEKLSTESFSVEISLKKQK